MSLFSMADIWVDNVFRYYFNEKNLMKISYVYIHVSLPTTTTTDRRKKNIESNYKA